MPHQNWFERIHGEKFTHPLPPNPGQIYGYCNFSNFYSSVIGLLGNGAVMVEIGTMAGLSTAIMAHLIRESKKDIDFYSVDPLPDAYGDESLVMYGQEFDVTMYQLFNRNLKHLRLLKYVTQLRMDSKDAAVLFEPASVDFVFIDGDHSTESVLLDIDSWKPKLKFGGIMAGHDYDHPSVRTAVNKRFDKVVVDGTCWISSGDFFMNSANIITSTILPESDD